MSAAEELEAALREAERLRDEHSESAARAWAMAQDCEAERDTARRHLARQSEIIADLRAQNGIEEYRMKGYVWDDDGIQQEIPLFRVRPLEALASVRVRGER